MISTLGMSAQQNPTWFQPDVLTGKTKLTEKETTYLRGSLEKLWKTYLQHTIKEEWDSCKITIDGITMPFWIKTFGEKPADGYSMYISLHGGGNCPAEVNDGQYENQKVLYSPKEGVYVVPRAPYNDWDMWFKPKLDLFYQRLIELAYAFADVNVNKVYIMGYSAGGDGVWRIAPRMADKWAASSMMAGHPGDVSLVNLRNTPFSIWCGGMDSAYDRNRRAMERGGQMDSLRRCDPEGYIHETHIVEGKGHWMDRADTAAVEWMSRFQRNPFPRKIVWRQEEKTRGWFYWVYALDNDITRGKELRLEVKDNVINISKCDYRQLAMGITEELVDFDKTVKIMYNRKCIFKGKLNRNGRIMSRSLFWKKDPNYMFPSMIIINSLTDKRQNYEAEEISLD